MGKIVAIGKYGLKLDDLKSSWINFDKSFSKHSILKKGLFVDLVLKDRRIVDVRVVDVPVGVAVVGREDVVSPLSSLSTSHNILKGQCLNIVFGKVSYIQLDNKEFRERAYELVLVMLKELELRGYEKW